MIIQNMNDALTLMHLSKPFSDANLIVDAASVENEMLLDIPAIPANKGQLHDVVFYDNVPKGSFIGYNMGVKPNNTQVQQKTEGLCKQASMFMIDKAMVDDSGDKAALVNFESRAHIEGMGRQQAECLIYGNKAKNPLVIDGLATRFRTKRSNRHERSKYNTGATQADVSTLYIAALGAKNLHMIYNPKFGNVGVKKTDKGEQQVKLDDGSFNWYYETLFEMEYGLAVEHPDSVWCITDIPASTNNWDKDKRIGLIDQVLHLQKRLPKGGNTFAIYCNIDTMEIIEKAAREAEVLVHPETDPWGKPVTMINGMRMRRMDCIPVDTSEWVGA